ncbi:MAG: cupin domain-containing protein [Thermoguttaceae bacterium]|nr:cupin domain-containing protein [Thermoguttaceae bacterium]
MLGTTTVTKARGADIGGAFSMVEIECPPLAGPMLHRHHREDEAFVALDGRFEFRTGDKTMEATAGACLFLPRGIPHTFKNIGAASGRLLVTMSPPGFEEFFVGVDELSQAGPPVLDEILALARRFDLDLLLPADLAPDRSRLTLRHSAFTVQHSVFTVPLAPDPEP